MMIGSAARVALWTTALVLLGSGVAGAQDRPNVILIVTDDQGVGDFGVMGNPIIRTPHLDAMAARSARLDNFFVHPVCSPTRASLMTGRYNHRTGVIDTYIGRSMMKPSEVTVAEALSGAGYATGLFGKWHLGDCYPMRPQDQGFEEVLMHRGGGLAQPSDPLENDRRYTDPILFENGEQVQKKGFCTDIYFEAALDWIDRCQEAERPFFAYIATNAPHGPFHDVPPDWLEQYRGRDLSNERFPKTEGHPLPDNGNLDRRARIFSMISNIDDNVGRLFAKLSEHGILEDTLVILINDNGPNAYRYTGGYRGMKSDVFDGGIRSVFFAHWPGRLKGGHRSDRIAADIDMMPTILGACGVAVPDEVALDGRNLMPLLEGAPKDWPDRTIVTQSHRGDVPVRYHHVAVRSQDWKLVHPTGFGRDDFEGPVKWQLYRVAKDPFELADVAQDHPEKVMELAAAYDRWFDDVAGERSFLPPRIVIGNPAEAATCLTRQDWRHLEGRKWGKDSVGQWLIEVERSGRFEAEVIRHPEDRGAGSVRLEWNEKTVQAEAREGAKSVIVGPIELPTGPIDLIAVVEGETKWGAYQVVLRRVE
ncbi:MAG: arylsulfatase [Planctomycetota bacterium]